MSDLIYNQRSIPRDQWRYGFRSSAATGCGWIAAYNALTLMDYETDIPELIRCLEWQLPLIHGNAGTTFWGPAVSFRSWGFPVEVLVDRAKFDVAARDCDVCILFYRWRRGIRLGPTLWPCITPDRVSWATIPIAIPSGPTPTGTAWMIFSNNTIISAPF